MRRACDGTPRACAPRHTGGERNSRMKKFEYVLLVATLLAVAGCHNSSGGNDADLGVDGGGIGGGGSDDMAVSPDLAPTAKLGCGGILQCLGSCTSQACAQGCYGKASASGTMKFQTMVQCLF